MNFCLSSRVSMLDHELINIKIPSYLVDISGLIRLINNSITLKHCHLGC